jgi:uncharacterized protein (UPF0147 family)
MAEHVWDGNELTPEVVRRWGYDDEFLLMEQDEDLLLYKAELIPLLLEMAADENCPKRDYIFSILCQFCRVQVARGRSERVAAIRSKWSGITEPADGYPLDWHRYVGRLLTYTQPSGPVDKQAARRMADELLLGIAGRTGSVVESEPDRAGWWRFTLRTSFTEHVDVCEASGNFLYTQSYSGAIA